MQIVRNTSQQTPPQQQQVTPPQQQQVTPPQGDALQYVSLRPSWARHPSSGAHPPAGHQSPVRRPREQPPSAVQPEATRPGHASHRRPAGDPASGHHSRAEPRHRQHRNTDHHDRSQQKLDDWTLVQNRRKRVIGKVTTTSSNLKGGRHPPTREIFISRVTDGDKRTIMEYMEEKGIQVYHFEKMSHYLARFLSFKIKISVFDKDTVLNENFWPTGVQCMMWKNAIQDTNRFNNENYDNINNGRNQYNNHGR